MKLLNKKTIITSKHRFQKTLKNLQPFYKNRIRISSRLVWWFSAFITLVAIFSYLTNPFVRFSLVNSNLSRIHLEGDQLVLEDADSPVLRDRVFFSRLAFLKSGWHVVSSKVSGGHKASRATVDQIINEIHTLRFDPNLPFIISGDHFSVFYNRSLGIFYHSLLDQRTVLNETDWHNRQLIYAKSLLYALDVYAQANRLSTTIVPIGPKSVALLNFYAYPSDTMYSLLYGIQALKTDSIHRIYNYESLHQIDTGLQTVDLGNQLQQEYFDTLKRHFDLYIETVVDPQTGLIRKDMYVSSTKDLVKRQSSFYDNVILWRTYQLADQLHLINLNETFLEDLRQKILDMYWLPEKGYFLDHLSDEAVINSHYSSDWLIAYQTGFLNAENEADRVYLEKTLEYIKRNALDRPFAIAYQAERRLSETHLIPRLAAPDYGSTAIWSNWGMEYAKLLIALAQATGEITYLTDAENQISAYAYNIRRYRGYPEVYNYEGDFYRQTFYKSIRQTGWVVSFEQAREMLEWTKLNWNSFENNT